MRETVLTDKIGMIAVIVIVGVMATGIRIPGTITIIIVTIIVTAEAEVRVDLGEEGGRTQGLDLPHTLHVNGTMVGEEM